MSLPEDAPCPRLCHLIKWPDFDGYGFNLHAEKSKSGQFIGKVDDNSPAVLAGLREGDKIIEVNFVNISNENHRQVVERIKSITNETRLLVVDEAADKWYRERKIVIKSTQPNVICYRTTVPRPAPGMLPIPCSPDLALRNRSSNSTPNSSLKNEEHNNVQVCYNYVGQLMLFSLWKTGPFILVFFHVNYQLSLFCEGILYNHHHLIYLLSRRFK